MAFTITGEAGKTMNATARSFETLRVSAAAVEFKSMDVDVFSYTSQANNSAGAGVTLPEEGQELSLFEDGTRRFKGVVTKVTPGESAWDIEVSGPWWWMDKVPLTGDLTDPSGATWRRTNFVVPTQNLSTSIRALIDRMISADVGVPMARGSVDATFQVVKQSFPNMSCAEALVQMLAWIPDAVTWFDYSGTTPELHVGRRDNLTVRTWTVGSSDLVQDSISIRAATGLRVTRVELNFAKRNSTTGKVEYDRQGAGTATPGQVLAVPISGPETVAFLPKDDFQSYLLKSASATGLDDLNKFFEKRDSFIAAVKKTYKSILGQVGVGGLATHVTTYSRAADITKRAKTTNFPGVKLFKENGNLANAAGKFLIVSNNPPQWVLDQYAAVPVTVTGTWFVSWRDSRVGKGTPFTDSYKTMLAGSDWSGSGYETQLPGISDFQMDWCARAVEAEGFLISTDFTRQTKVFKAWDYDFVQPPADLATNLRAAANWVPYEGNFTVISDTVSPLNRIASRVRIANSRAELATMDALPRAIKYDLMEGLAHWKLGAPARVDFQTLVGRVKREPSDNIFDL